MQERRSNSEGVKAEYKTVVFQNSFCLDRCTLTRSLLCAHSLRDIRVKYVAADEKSCGTLTYGGMEKGTIIKSVAIFELHFMFTQSLMHRVLHQTGWVLL